MVQSASPWSLGIDNMPNLLVNNVSLDYVSPMKAPGKRFARKKRVVHALKNISFAAHQGEFVGLVGRNGSGKSSLLRMMAGLQTPTRGEIYASTNPTLIGISAALNNELSGDDNIALGCLAMGMTPEQIEKARPQVAELAGIGDAIYRPMSSYSSGMGSRLRFAISMAARPHIMLIDEALSAGDASFAERAKNAMQGLLDNAGTVFLVSHAAQTIEEMCTRAIWLDMGEFVMDGDAREVARKYRWFAHNLAMGDEKKAAQLLYDAKELGAQGYVKNSEDTDS